MKKTPNKKIKRKLRVDRILIFLALIFIIVCVFYLLFNIKFKNIYILNNNMLNDQYIIEKAQISNYPSILKNFNFKIEERLKNDIYIKDAKVYKKGVSNVYIEVLENRPLFYYSYSSKTVLSDGQVTTDKFIVPTVINQISDDYYFNFIEQMNKLDNDILLRISEIKFSPNEVDDNRFLITMNDGNYVYINISTFEKLNKYLTIKEKLPNKIGILYLDYGNNFEIIK